MNVLMISPGYPAEMAFFTRGLAAAGASVIGVGDQPVVSVPAIARDALAHYIPVGSLAAGDAVAATVRELARQVRIDRVECLWEPYMMLAAQLRQDLDLPGLTVAQTVPFRDKERMIFKRAEGAGRISHYQGPDHLLAEYGAHVAAVELLPVGAARRDWRAVSISGGMVIVRHGELSKTIEMAERFASDLHLYAE